MFKLDDNKGQAMRVESAYSSKKLKGSKGVGYMLAKTELDGPHANLLRAAEYIEKHGWWNGKGKGKHFPTKNEPACLVVAICQIGDSSAWRAVELIRKHLKDTDPAVWNDTHTKDEVINLLREVAYS